MIKHQMANMSGYSSKIEPNNRLIAYLGSKLCRSISFLLLKKSKEMVEERSQPSRIKTPVFLTICLPISRVIFSNFSLTYFRISSFKLDFSPSSRMSRCKTYCFSKQQSPSPRGISTYSSTNSGKDLANE